MELRVAESAYFVTLTYDPEHVPYVCDDDGVIYETLVKEDLTLFLKRLRAYILRTEGEDDRWCKKSEKSQKWSPKLRYFAHGS